MYAGDGRTAFGLPDLRGRVPIHVGTGPGLSSYTTQGQRGGSETISNSITLQQDNLPDVISTSATIEGITASLSNGAISGSFDGSGDHFHTVNDHTHPFTYDSFTFPDADAGTSTTEDTNIVPFGNMRGLKGKTKNQGLKQLQTQLDDLQAQLDEIIATGGVVGPPGTDGKDGEDGEDGAVGLQGSAGKDGEDGAPGADGKDGEDGAVGLQGSAGADGLDGKDGEDGAVGLKGSAGKDGEDGAPGVDGKDGAVCSVEDAEASGVTGEGGQQNTSTESVDLGTFTGSVNDLTV